MLGENPLLRRWWGTGNRLPREGADSAGQDSVAGPHQQDEGTWIKSRNQWRTGGSTPHPTLPSSFWALVVSPNTFLSLQAQNYLLGCFSPPAFVFLALISTIATLCFSPLHSILWIFPTAHREELLCMVKWWEPMGGAVLKSKAPRAYKTWSFKALGTMRMGTAAPTEWFQGKKPLKSFLAEHTSIEQAHIHWNKEALPQHSFSPPDPNKGFSHKSYTS